MKKRILQSLLTWAFLSLTCAYGAGIGGTWKTSYGQMTFPDVLSGSVEAPYTEDGGRIIGTINGTVLSGHWIENGSAHKCQSPKDGSYYWGRVTYTFNQDFSEFSGTWGYCSNAPTKKWTGRLISTAGSCSYEKEIYQLIQALKSSDYSKAIVKRIGYINEMDKVDRNTQFVLCSDQDGKATLKFNTPEEKLRDNISKLGGYLSWFSGKMGIEIDGMAKKALDNLNDIQSKVSKYKTKKLTSKDKFENLLTEYRQLKKARTIALKNLSELADRSLCFGITSNHLKLAELYHNTIPNNRSCNELEKRALLDRIKRDQSPGFAPFLNKKTYHTVKSKCRNVQ